MKMKIIFIVFLQLTVIIKLIGGDNMKLSKKLALSFILSIMVSIIIISFISNYMINNRFETYLASEQEMKFNRIHEEINKLYIENNYNIDEMNLMHYSINEDINLVIYDNEGNIIYNSGNGMGMGMGMNRNRMKMMNRVPEGNFVEKTYPLTDSTKNIGALVIGYIDNSYLTDSAIIFKDTLAKSLIASGFFAIAIGILISIGLSKGLTKPLININQTANKIRQGDLKAKTSVNTNTTEVVELSETINYLGNTLLRQEDIRKRYASDISHELRTPLTTLKTHIEAIMDGVWEPTNEHLDILMKEVNRLSNLVNDLKDSFIQEEYSMHLNKTSFIISNELENIVTSYQPIYQKENYILTSSIEKDIEVVMDLDKFNQIISNLLSNSLRYLNEGGKVSIDLKKYKNTIKLTVKDNGIGIKEEDLKNIFERFYRADSSRNKSTGGSGLGLSIVKSIVEAHNGTITINSKYGKGTLIEIQLPI